MDRVFFVVIDVDLALLARGEDALIVEVGGVVTVAAVAWVWVCVWLRLVWEKSLVWERWWLSDDGGEATCGVCVDEVQQEKGWM